MNIYISNLDSAIKAEELTTVFSAYGSVNSAEVVMDVFTGESRGFGYVEMNDEEGEKAIEKLNNSVLHELTISVKQAEPRKIPQGSYKVGNGPVDAYRFRKN
jgi:RNA recognition motif-containing protein